jgi:hypothetical protein
VRIAAMKAMIERYIAAYLRSVERLPYPTVWML